MVGVPGRSRGCSTCRKRKKRCDLERPACGQCRGRGTACGGYDSDRMFVHQTGRGNDFAAKKLLSDADVDANVVQPPRSNQVLPVRPVPETQKYKPRSPCASSFMVADSFAPSAYTEGTLAAFIHMYLPLGGQKAADAEGREFINMLSMLTVRDQALQLAVQAIGTAALGRSMGDDVLSRQSIVLYGKALSETGAVLRDTSRAHSEAALMTPRIMALFEVLYGTEARSPIQAKSWLSHAVGETALVLGRNPETYSQTDAAHSLFVNTRFRLVVSAARARKATVLNNKEWKTLPWRHRSKTANDTLVDVFCGVPELAQAIDALRSATLSEVDIESLRAETCAKAWALHLQLQGWRAANPGLMLTPTGSDTADVITPISFPHLECACRTLRYWVVALLVYSHLDNTSGVFHGDERCTKHADRPDPCMYARLIARSAPYFFQERHGLVGATTFAFPLGMALLCMSRNMAPHEPYVRMVTRALEQRTVPAAIRDFLVSMRRNIIPPIEAVKTGIAS